MEQAFDSNELRSRAIRRWALTSTAVAALLAFASPAAAAVDCPPIVTPAHMVTHRVPQAVHRPVAHRPHKPAVHRARPYRKAVPRKADHPKVSHPAVIAPAASGYATVRTYVGPVAHPQECAWRPIELATAPPMSPAPWVVPAPAAELLTSLLPPLVDPETPAPFTPGPPDKVFTPPDSFRPPLTPPPPPPGILLPVPEPATWAMMLLGFFGVGAALRLRRARPTALSREPEPRGHRDRRVSGS